MTYVNEGVDGGGSVKFVKSPDSFAGTLCLAMFTASGILIYKAFRKLDQFSSSGVWGKRCNSLVLAENSYSFNGLYKCNGIN
jgi:hypothetical protein